MASFSNFFNVDFKAPDEKTLYAGLNVGEVTTGRSPEQLEELVRRWATRVEAGEEGAEWSDVIKADAVEYWTKGMSLSATRLAGRLYGMDPKMGQKELAGLLAEAKCPPVPLSFLQSYASRMVLVAHGVVDPDAPGIPKKKDVVPPVGSGKPGAGGEQEGPAVPVMAPELMAQMAMMWTMFNAAQPGAVSAGAAAAAAAAKAATDAAAAKAAAVKVAPREKLLKEVEEAIGKRGLVDPVVLQAAYLKKLGLRSAGFTSAKQTMALTAAGMLETVDPDVVPESDMYNPAAVMEGTVRWISMCCVSEAYSRADVKDLLEWFLRVQQTKFPSSVHRAMYLKGFMDKHRGKHDWCDLLESDFLLMREIVDSVAVGGGGHSLQGGGAGGAQQPSGAGGGYGAVVKQRVSPTKAPYQQNPGAQQGHPGKGGAGQPLWYCKSRYLVADGACKWEAAGKGKCGFSHACAACGGDHSAKDCKTWSEPQARANVAKTGGKW